MRRTLPDPERMCGHTHIGATGLMWICIAAPHGPDDPIPPDVDPQYWDRASHYFVRIDEADW